MLTLDTPTANQSSFFEAICRAVRKLTSTRANPAWRKAPNLEARMLSRKHGEELRAHVDHLRVYYGGGL